MEAKNPLKITYKDLYRAAEIAQRLRALEFTHKFEVSESDATLQNFGFDYDLLEIRGISVKIPKTYVRQRIEESIEEAKVELANLGICITEDIKCQSNPSGETGWQNAR